MTNMLKYAKLGKNLDGDVNLCSYDRAWYNVDSGIIFVRIYQISTECGDIVVHHSII